jgi:drug/metabolite transporter superfamily protein YnfA
VKALQGSLIKNINLNEIAAGFLFIWLKNKHGRRFGIKAVISLFLCAFNK